MASVPTHLSISALGDLCGMMRARNLDLFEQLGSWVVDASPLQRRFAQASHQHAWHAELWASRCPKIPIIDLDTITTANRSTPVPVHPADRAGIYCDQVHRLLSELSEVALAVDPELDPSTTRVLQLVGADLEAQRQLYDR